MVATSQNFPAGPFVDPETGALTQGARRFLLSLFQRTGAETGNDNDAIAALANGALLKANALSELRGSARARSNLFTGATISGWSAPTGTVSRAALNAGWSGTASASYTQSDLQDVVAQLEAVSASLGALITDCASFGVLSFWA